MSQPGKDSSVAFQKKTALENKWTASKARLWNIISSIGTSEPSSCAASCTLKQLDLINKYMVSVFDEMTAILTPTEQDEFIEDFNKQERVYNEARSKLRKVEREIINAKFPTFAKFDGKSFFTFFQSVIHLDAATRDEVKNEYLKQCAPGNSTSVKWDVYFRENKNNIASDAALEMLKMKQMPLTLLLERFRKCIFLLSFTGHDRDWKLLLGQIIRECLTNGPYIYAEEKLEKVIRSVVDCDVECSYY